MTGGFWEYLQEATGDGHVDAVLSAFDDEASVSVRLNPSKTVSAQGLFEGIEMSRVPWSPHGYLLSGRPAFTLDPLFHGGAYYVQDSSSMFVGEMFRRIVGEFFGGVAAPGRPLRVLDLCAAPGGKSTDIAASLREMCGEDFLLVVNEVMKQRAGTLADNMALWGEPNVMVTNADPAAFSQLEGYFDIILADVPCSGEGMFRKDGQARRLWSADNVALCAARQRRIIGDVWPALAPGGAIIYSTCTFNRYENDLNVEWIVENLGAMPVGREWFSEICRNEGVLGTEYGYSLVPGLVKGEGQYCAALLKEGGRAFSCRRSAGAGQAGRSMPIEKLFNVPVALRQKGGLVIALPANIAAEMEAAASRLRPLRVGCAAGEVKGNDFVPCADLALSIMLERDAFPSAELSREEALRFLHRDAIFLPESERGYLLVMYGGVALGFVKNLGNRCNNLHPQGRRIRMDI